MSNSTKYVKGRLTSCPFISNRDLYWHFHLAGYTAKEISLLLGKPKTTINSELTNRRYEDQYRERNKKKNLLWRQRTGYKESPEKAKERRIRTKINSYIKDEIRAQSRVPKHKETL